MKRLLYVLRTTLTGIHLLETGELETDLTRLMGPYGFEDACTLVERKRAGERVGQDSRSLQAWRPRVDGLFVRLEQARAGARLADGSSPGTVRLRLDEPSVPPPSHSFDQRRDHDEQLGGLDGLREVHVEPGA